jgi:flagellin-like hook-associated protein FlgL
MGPDSGATLQEEALLDPEEENMSDITLSAAVRSNLLSLQNTASLLDTTQTRLATGNKVNSALDNPTSYFTAQSLNARASDLGNLLDSVGNAIQTIQAANDGITSITKLVESAQATANQAQQLSEKVEDQPAVAAAAAYALSTKTGLTGTSDATALGLADGDTLTLSGGNFTNVSISFKADGTGDLDTDTLTAQDVIDEINSQAGATIASLDGGKLKITAQDTATDITVGGTNGLGLTATAHVAAAAATQKDNPARAALVSQYNGLLDQIDQLTKDAGYNGNNLLAGATTQLKVVFNESGTSSLTISGKDTSASGLGLNQLTATDFATNASITTVLSTLKTAQDTLRANASSFGSQLSIVQTRQDFTKALINTLQTGASNLTLADSNEEAANLLALQTRQSLSTKALSLASQSDQNVLRLLQ